MDEGTADWDPVFRALADRTRRVFLDRLREQDGQTLGELCARLGMARQSATQHLDVLVRAGLVPVVRRGRERLHFLNPAAISEIGERWISALDRPRLDALQAIRQRAEDHAMTERTAPVPTYVYVTSIRASAEQVRHALTDTDLTARYWGHANVSDRQPGSRWEHRRARTAAARGGAIELAVHGWDVATTCGSGRRMPVGLATDLFRAATALVDDRTRRPAFGPPVPVPAEAAPEDRLVAFLGRRPPAVSW